MLVILYYTIMIKACQAKLCGSRRSFKQTQGAYHLTENFGNSGRKVNGKVTFRKFQPKIEEYVLR